MLLLVGSVLLLVSFESVTDSLDTIFASASIFVYDHFWSLVGVVAFLTTTSTVALLIDRYATFQMFLDVEEHPNEAATGKKRPSSSGATAKLFNWLMSWIFVSSLISILSGGERWKILFNGTVIQFVLEQSSTGPQSGCNVDVLLCFLSMSYLLGSFAHAVFSRRRRCCEKGKDHPSLLFLLAPASYLLSLAWIVTDLDQSFLLRTCVAAVVVLVVLVCHITINSASAAEASEKKAVTEDADVRRLDGRLKGFPSLVPSHYPEEEKENVRAMEIPSYIIRGYNDGNFTTIKGGEGLTSLSTKLSLASNKGPLTLLVSMSLASGLAVASWKGFFKITLVPVDLFLLTYFALWAAVVRQLCTRSSIAAKQVEDLDLVRRRLKGYPPPFPNGWYKLADSAEVRPGQVLGVSCLGRKFAVFRGERNRRVSVLDAHCPHLGADLTAGGTVRGDCLECPFHGWQFHGSDGRCTKIPYTDRVPVSAAVRSWPVLEYYGQVCVFFSPEPLQGPPPYYPPTIEQLESGTFVPRGSHEEIIDMHIIEFAENSVDFQHFQPLHGRMMVPFTEWHLPLVTIQHDASWEADPVHKHLAYFRDKAKLLFHGHAIPHSDGRATITFVGPGGLTYFTFHSPWGDIILFHTHTPLKPLRQRVQFRWYADKAVPRLLVWYIVGNWIAQYRNDVLVWENKIYKPRPLLVKGDGPVAALRRWYKQFYDASDDATEAKKSGQLMTASITDLNDW